MHPASALRRWTVVALWACVVAVAQRAWAHHGPHGGGVSARDTGLAERRSTTANALGFAISYSTSREVGSAGDVLALKPFGEYAFNARLGARLALPILHVMPEDASAEAGIGNLQLAAKYALHTPDSREATWALRALVGLPTQSVRLGIDPGPVWNFGIGVAHTRLSGPWLAQIDFGVLGDTRRAGTALDLAPAMLGGYLLASTSRLLLGLRVRARVASWCRIEETTRWCRTGRASEPATDLGETLLLGEAGVELGTSAGSGLSLTLQLPVSPSRDFDALIALSGTLF